LCSGKNICCMNKVFIFLALWGFSVQSVISQDNSSEGISDSPFADSVLVFMPFTDHSGFGGKWNISEEVPRYLALYCREKFRASTITPIAVEQFAEEKGITASGRSSVGELTQFAEHFKARYIVTASIEDFSVARFNVAEQTLAGYEAFSGEVDLHYIIFDVLRFPTREKDAIVSEGDVSGIVKDKELGITLLGKQTDRTYQFYALDNLSFGGEAFNKTVIGEAMVKCAESFSSKLGQALPRLEPIGIGQRSTESTTLPEDTSFHLSRQVMYGEVIVLDGETAFLNVGSDDGVEVGDRIPVMRNDDIIGEVKVSEVRSAHLSFGTVVKGIVRAHDSIVVTVLK
jgi:hypothetical protein